MCVYGYPGADPTKHVEDLARKKKIRTLGVSMGQGQEIIARTYLTTAVAEGQWLLLQNTHLGLAYLNEVQGHDTFYLLMKISGHTAGKYDVPHESESVEGPNLHVIGQKSTCLLCQTRPLYL